MKFVFKTVCKTKQKTRLENLLVKKQNNTLLYVLFQTQIIVMIKVVVYTYTFGPHKIDITHLILVRCYFLFDKSG